LFSLFQGQNDTADENYSTCRIVSALENLTGLLKYQKPNFTGHKKADQPNLRIYTMCRICPVLGIRHNPKPLLVCTRKKSGGSHSPHAYGKPSNAVKRSRRKYHYLWLWVMAAWRYLRPAGVKVNRSPLALICNTFGLWRLLLHRYTQSECIWVMGMTAFLWCLAVFFKVRLRVFYGSSHL